MVDCGGEIVPDEDAFDEDAINANARANRKDEEESMPEDDHVDVDPDAPVDRRFDPNTYKLSPRSWTTFWKLLKSAGLRMRFIRNPYACKVTQIDCYMLIGGFSCATTRKRGWWTIRGRWSNCARTRRSSG
jgi:hypothetical protein